MTVNWASEKKERKTARSGAEGKKELTLKNEESHNKTCRTKTVQDKKSPEHPSCAKKLRTQAKDPEWIIYFVDSFF